MRRRLAEAAYINRFRGTLAAMDRLGEAALFTVSVRDNRGGNRVESVDIYVTNSAGRVATAEWATYVTDELRRMIPYDIAIGVVHIVSAVEVPLYVGWQPRGLALRTTGG